MANSVPQRQARQRAIQEIADWLDKLPQGLDSLEKFERIIRAKDTLRRTIEHYDQLESQLFQIDNDRQGATTRKTRAATLFGLMTVVAAGTAAFDPFAGAWAYYAAVAPGTVAAKAAVDFLRAKDELKKNSEKARNEKRDSLTHLEQQKAEHLREASAAISQLSPFERQVFTDLEFEDPQFINSIRSGRTRRCYTQSLVENANAIVGARQMNLHYPIIPQVAKTSPNRADELRMRAVEMEVMDELGPEWAKDLGTIWGGFSNLPNDGEQAWPRARLLDLWNSSTRRERMLRPAELESLDQMVADFASPRM